MKVALQTPLNTVDEREAVLRKECCRKLESTPYIVAIVHKAKTKQTNKNKCYVASAGADEVICLHLDSLLCSLTAFRV